MYIRGLVLSVVVLFLMTGCYTKFVTNQKISAEQVTAIIDSTTGDTVKVINRIDTVVQKEREVCVWERDLMGYPRLRCYKTFYPRDWYVYNNTPWWYNDPYWGDYDRCPRNYYYDPNCGCCKFGPPERHNYRYNDYHRYDPHHNSSGSSGNSTNHNGSSSVTEKPIPQSSRTTGTKVPVTEVKQPAVQKDGVTKVPQENVLDKKTDVEPPGVAPETDTVKNVKKRDLRSLRSR
jgi:hypothetical protein